MTTSGTYSFTVTRDDLIREAMLNIGKLDAYGAIDPIEQTDCARKLNMMVKTWMGTYDFAPGLKIWTRQRADLFLSSQKGQYLLGPTGDNWAGSVATSTTTPSQSNTLTVAAAAGATVLTVGSVGAAEVTVGDYVVCCLTNGDTQSTTCTAVNLGAGTITIANALTVAMASGGYVYNYTTKAQRPEALVTAVLRDTNANDTPMNFMTIQTYEALPTKTTTAYQSDPTTLYYEAQLNNGVLYLDVGGAGDVTKFLHIVYLRPTQDFNNPLDTPEYPSVWYEALSWGLSKRICPMFDGRWDQTMETNYQAALQIARESYSDMTETYFQPNADTP